MSGKDEEEDISDEPTSERKKSRDTVRFEKEQKRLDDQLDEAEKTRERLITTLETQLAKETKRADDAEDSKDAMYKWVVRGGGGLMVLMLAFLGVAVGVVQSGDVNLPLGMGTLKLAPAGAHPENVDADFGILSDTGSPGEVLTHPEEIGDL